MMMSHGTVSKGTEGSEMLSLRQRSLLDGRASEIQTPLSISWINTGETLWAQCLCLWFLRAAVPCVGGPNLRFRNTTSSAAVCC